MFEAVLLFVFQCVHVECLKLLCLPPKSVGQGMVPNGAIRTHFASTTGQINRNNNSFLQSTHPKEVLIDTVEKQKLTYRDLKYIKRRRGRALIKHIELLGLQSGDRLLPTKVLPDVSKFEYLELPVVVHFWRSKPTDRMIHECPLINIEGVSPSVSYAIDLLHTWHLGPIAAYVGYVFRFLLESRIWCSNLHFLASEDAERLGLLELKSRMWQYYAEKRQGNPDWAKTSSEVSAQCCCCR